MNLRKLSTAVLIAVLSTLIGLNSAYAAPDARNVKMFMGDFDGESRIYAAAMLDTSGWVAVAFQNIDTANAYEDDVLVSEDRTFWVDLLLDNSHRFNHNNKTFVWWILDATDRLTGARINGALAQVVSIDGIVNDGLITVIRDAGNPLTCKTNCSGYFVQNGNGLYRFVYTVVEQETYTVFLPLVVR